MFCWVLVLFIYLFVTLIKFAFQDNHVHSSSCKFSDMSLISIKYPFGLHFFFLISADKTTLLSIRCTFTHSKCFRCRASGPIPFSLSIFWYVTNSAIWILPLNYLLLANPLYSEDLICYCYFVFDKLEALPS